jgi:hypothetical protein
MKYFVGAKSLTGQVIVAEMIDVCDFDDALITVTARAQQQAGPGNFRITAVNECLFSEPATERLNEFPSRSAR